MSYEKIFNLDEDIDSIELDGKFSREQHEKEESVENQEGTEIFGLGEDTLQSLNNKIN